MVKKITDTIISYTLYLFQHADHYWFHTGRTIPGKEEQWFLCTHPRSPDREEIELFHQIEVETACIQTIYIHYNRVMITYGSWIRFVSLSLKKS